MHQTTGIVIAKSGVYNAPHNEFMIKYMSQAINITLPDGAVRELRQGALGLDLAANISSSLAKAALAVKINGKVADLRDVLNDGDVVEIITAKSEDGLEVIRHDAAHTLAHAVKELYPHAQVTIGPTIENGFYYDFAIDNPFSEDDLANIEVKMKEIVKSNIKIERYSLSRAEAIKYFESIGEDYKVEIIKEIPESDEIKLYRQGQFTDLCRGPHGMTTASAKAFKLTKVSGAYWRGDSKNKMLQRIYGTAWATQEELDNYITLLKEIEKRDHRRIGRAMNLFHMQEEAPGAVFWHPNGWKLLQLLIDYMRAKCSDYQEVNTPEVLDHSIWIKSGHAEKFSESMFKVSTIEGNREYCIKPMSCPGAVQIFKENITSYKDLPIRLSEYGKVHRYEPSGALYGLMRVRAFTQDDAHIFCMEEQIKEECQAVCKLSLDIYKEFGFKEVKVKVSTRPEKRIGSDEVWDKSEQALMDALSGLGLEYKVMEGEGAFYGPKIEFAIKDALGRDWQMGTVQIDFNLPERFSAVFTDSNGAKIHPVMIHRAIFGSLERFIGILLEHSFGHLPLWLAPMQVVVAPITDDVSEYAHTVADALLKVGIRCMVDNSNETINYKIRQHSLAKVPLLCILGRTERDNNAISLRKLGETDQQIIAFNEFVDKMKHMGELDSLCFVHLN